MGTSSAYGGPGGGTPLIPSWLDSGDGAPASPDGTPPGGADPTPAPDGPKVPSPPVSPAPPPPQLPPIPVPSDSGRFTAARNNFSRYAGSGGSDRKSLGRALSNYVSKAS